MNPVQKDQRRSAEISGPADADLPPEGFASALTPTIVQPTLAELEASELFLKSLLRIDSSNPPGYEREIVEQLRWECTSEGFEPIVVGARQNRPNLVTRLAADPANRKGPPLVLSCHLDTVPADESRWTHPPFSGHEEGGYIWGRGAIDMKGFAAMAFAVLLLLKKRKLPINRDVIFAAVADEEAGTDLGSKWLVDNRPDLLGDRPEYVINEVGGFTVNRDGRRVYPVQVAEKGIAWLRLTAEGEPGHSSLPLPESAVSRISEAVLKIMGTPLPWHPSKPAKRFIKELASGGGRAERIFAPLLATRLLGPRMIRRAIPDPKQRAAIEAVLRNTAMPTRIQGGDSPNMLPTTASVDIDGRLAPGQKAKYLISELHKVLGDPDRERYRFEILRESPAVEFSTDTALYEHIKETMMVRDPEGQVVPSIVPGFTDSRNYAKLGATCYGFYPLQLPPYLDFASLFHGDNERIPIDGMRWGIGTLSHLLSRFLTS